MSNFSVGRLKKLAVGRIALGLLVILSILIVFAPISMPAIQGTRTPLSLSVPGQLNDLVSGLPRTNDLTDRPTTNFASSDGAVRKAMAFPLWLLITSCIALAFRLIIARFVRVIRNLTWFHYLFHLLDLPPPASVPVSV